MLSDRFNKIRKTQNSSLARALVLLADCKIYGTLPFSHLARAGFVAISLLESFVEESIITQEELQRFNFKKGDTVKAKLLEIDIEKERVSLGIKQLTQDPMEDNNKLKKSIEIPINDWTHYLENEIS